MASLVQQSTTQLPLKFFLVSSSDHITAVTGLGSGPTVTIRKEGGSFAAPSGAISEIANGWYQVAANATDTNTLGEILLHATGTGSDPCDMIAAEVVAFNPQDAVHLGISALPNTACTNNASLITSGSGTDQLTVSGGIASSDAKKINAVSTSSVTTVNANIGETQPINFTGTGGSALVKSDMTDIAGSAVSTSSAQLGVNVVNYAGVAAAVDANNFPKVDVEDVGGAALATHAAGMVPADVRDIAGSAVNTSSAQLGVNVVNIAGQAAALDGNNLLKVDVEDINGNATAAQNVSKANQAIGRGTCTTGGSTTSIPTSAWSPGGASVVSGQFIGRTIIFDANTTTASLQGQATNITANTSGSTPTFTVTALTTAPSSGDTFSVV